MNKKYLYLLLLFLTSCYSFTGGNIPEYLNTLYIVPVVDKSGFGNPIYRDQLNVALVDQFRTDNSFNIVDDPSADAKLEVTIRSISDNPVAVSQGALETERKINFGIEVSYYDNVKRKEIWNKTFSAFDLYEIQNAQVNRNEAIESLIDQLSQDVLIAVVSGW